MNSAVPFVCLMLAVLSQQSTCFGIREFRIGLPFTLEECEIGHLWSTAEFELLETGGTEGVELVVNEPFEEDGVKGQFAHKIFHLASKVPRVIRMLAPKGSLEIHSESWNSYPYVKSIISNPDYMKDGFYIKIQSLYIANDDCQQDNVFELGTEKLNKRDVVFLDILTDPVSTSDYSADSDPSLCPSKSGPLTSDWKSKYPHMCVYKLAETEFKWFGLQGTVESRLLKALPRLFRNLHRDMFCWADQWADLTMDDVREKEAKTKLELDRLRGMGEVRGMSEQ